MRVILRNAFNIFWHVRALGAAYSLMSFDVVRSCKISLVLYKYLDLQEIRPIITYPIDVNKAW